MLGVDQDPTLRHPAIASTPRRDSDSPLERGHGLQDAAWARTSCASVKVAGTRVIHFSAGLRELLQIVRAIEGTIGDQIGRAVGGVQLRKVVRITWPNVLRITAIATERFHQHRNAGLVFDDQIQHHLVEVGPMIAAIAPGDVNDLFGGLLVTVIAAIDMEAGAIEMGEGGARPKRLAAVAAMRL